MCKKNTKYYLYAPWRLAYEKVKKERTGCPFCIEPAGLNDKEIYIIKQYAHCFVMLNRYPYTAGHLMVVPYRHVEKLTQLSVQERTELMEVVNQTMLALEQWRTPAGFNVGINQGAVGGAGIPEHLHVHVVPRRQGDTSFLGTTANTCVMYYDLDTVFNELKKLL